MGLIGYSAISRFHLAAVVSAKADVIRGYNTRGASAADCGVTGNGKNGVPTGKEDYAVIVALWR